MQPTVLTGSPRASSSCAGLCPSARLRRWLSAGGLSLLAFSLLALSLPARALDFPVELPLARSGAGTLTINAEVGGQRADFLVDTGAGMVTISRELFESLEDTGELREVRRVALRLANNRVKAVPVYAVAHFRLGLHCDLGPLEVAVLGSGSRNLLGLSALTRAAPFALDPRSPTLFLSQCSGESRVAGLH
ncbi:retropepsin-like aspartic protease [Parahaliea mediterranea]|uniref:retropepsin-like aspartic protease n=1 Tax=Parahaliea mediterranea TaxID=651086 RepID=UPI000E2F0A5C|nr:retropepsin-like aspartic protease [Parahaliea mediterranea]